MRALVASVFALAVASTILAGDGVILVPHTHAPGTPAEHPHGLAMYRFPIALLGAPAEVPQRTDRSTAPAFRAADPFAQTLASASLLISATAQLALAMALTARTRVPAIALRYGEQWSSLIPTGPPRALLSV